MTRLIPEKPTHRVTLQPVQAELTAPAGTALRDLLFAQGVEFPCGGQGRCRGCRVHVLEGQASVNDAQRERLSAEELPKAGGSPASARWKTIWLSSCANGMPPSWWMRRPLLSRRAPAWAWRWIWEPPRWSTQLLDLSTGRVLAVRTALNSQARFGADVMSRVEFAVAKGGEQQLRDLIRQQIGSLIEQLVFAAQVPEGEITDVVVVGNTVMHHLFCGLDIEPLSRYPFESEQLGLQTFAPGIWDGSSPARRECVFSPAWAGSWAAIFWPAFWPRTSASARS